ncbi:hypothetical protein ACT3TQ_06870 [Halomonas sp. AOP12-C2-37]|uniref:hypothetical protein n=1 Tax=unclassified Halomonas TaxID=2609666 RepID=UPI004033A979
MSTAIGSTSNSQRLSNTLGDEKSDRPKFSQFLEGAKEPSDSASRLPFNNVSFGSREPESEVSDKGQEMLDELVGDDSEYAPYMDGKPELVTEDELVSKDKIEYVSQEYVGGGGVTLSYWFDMLEVRTENGDKFLVQKDITPELYEQVKSVMDGGDTDRLGKDNDWADADIPDDDKDWLSTKSNQDFEIITPNSDVPIPKSFNDISYSDFGDLDDISLGLDSGVQITLDDSAWTEGGTLIYKDSEGKRFAVSEEYTPKVYDQIKNLKETWDEVDEKIGDGDYKLFYGSDDSPVLSGDNEVDSVTDKNGNPVEGIKLVTKGDETYVVLESKTPHQFDTITSDAASQQLGDVDDLFKDKDLPASDETDVMQAETTEDGKTVAELYQEYMKEAYKDAPDDSKEAKYLRLMEAQGMLQGNFQYLPYNTGPGRHGSDTDYAEKMSELKAADARGMLDEEALGNELSDLMADEDIMADSEDFLEKAVDKIKNKDELEDKIADSMLDDDYIKALEELKEDGNIDGAATRFANDMQSLQMLSPDRAEEVQNTLKFQDAIGGLNDIFEGGADAVGEDSLGNASGDVATSLLQGMVTSLFGTKRGVDIYNKIVNGEKVDVSPEEREKLTEIKNSHKALTELLGDQSREILDTSKNGKIEYKSITADEIDRAIDKANVPTADRKGVAGVLGTLTKSGALASAAGLTSMVAGIYKMSDGGLNLGATENERIEVARNFLSLVGVTPSLIRLTGESYKLLSGQPDFADALGLDKSLKESVWDKHFDTKSSPTPPSIPDHLPTMDLGESFSTKDVWEEVNKNQSHSVDSIDKAISGLPDKHQEEGDDLRERINKVADDIRGPNIPDNIDANKKFQWAGGALNVLGGMADAGGGVLDIVLGAKGLEKLSNNGGEPIEFAQKSLQVGAGSFSTTMGLASAASGFGIGPQIATKIAAVTGLAGAALGFIGAILSGVMSALADKKNAGVTKDIENVFNDLSGDGVTEDDWGDKFNFAIHTEYSKSVYHEGKLDAIYESWFPEDTPTWEAQPEVFEEFTETVADDGEISEGWLRDSFDDLVMHEYGEEFYDEHRDKIELISRKWTDWDGSDDIVSRKDLEKLLESDDTTKEEKEAINLLLKDDGFFEVLDYFSLLGGSNRGWNAGSHKGSDDKISSRDLNEWRHTWIDKKYDEHVEENFGDKFYKDNADNIEYISERWTKWDGSDDVVSRNDLEKLLDSEDTSKKDKDVIRWLLEEEEGLFNVLDTYHKGGDEDDKISSKDLNKFREDRMA